MLYFLVSQETLPHLLREKNAVWLRRSSSASVDSICSQYKRGLESIHGPNSSIYLAETFVHVSRISQTQH